MQKRAFIDAARCNNCAVCVIMDSCSNGAVDREAPEENPYINGFCTGCGKCTRICPHGAVYLV